MIAVVKYNAGNIRSVLCALERLEVEARVTDDPAVLRHADKVIFPGVGEASTAMACLRKSGLDEVLTELTQPFLGICLGMQLMCSFSEEHDTRCLGMFDTTVRRFPSGAGCKIPHMGWNTIDCSDDPLFAGIAPESYVYFVHSYYAPTCGGTIATCGYAGLTFSCALRKDNFRGVQFHPEKSGAVGERILRNFLAL